MLTLNTIQQALRIPGFDSRAAQGKMSPRPRAMVRPPDKPGTVRCGAVLLLLYRKYGEVHTVLIRRQENLKYHPGQMSLPGGRREKNESFLTAALREAQEEVGIDPAALKVLGGLEPVYIPPSDFCVHPFVAWHDGAPGLTREAKEVAEIFEIPVARLLAPESRDAGEQGREAQGSAVPFFKISGHKVWGATAMILSEFLERLQAALSGDA